MRAVLSSLPAFYARFVGSGPDAERFFGDCFGLVGGDDAVAKSEAEMSTVEKMLVGLYWAL